jgi:hypothetical protein
MRIPRLFAQKEKGQVIVLLAIMAVTILAFILFLVAGGMVMINRRQAQAAADAGALAGARMLCEKNPDAASIAVAYAMQNNAASADASIAGNNVTVNATANRGSGLIGIFPGTSSPATATAACIIPSNGVMPVAWFCADPAVAYCGVDMFDWDVSHIPSGTLYLVVDPSSTKEDDPWATCEGTTYTTSKGTTVVGKMICDITANGLHVKVLGNGQRSYIQDVCKDSNPKNCLQAILDGISGASSITLGSYPIHPGAIDSFYQTLASHVPYVYVLPYYDSFDAKNVYVKGVASFMVTCASWQPGKTNGCPGKAIWLDANTKANKNFGGAWTMEGYFVKNYPVDIVNPGSIDAPNMGTYYISLTK